MNDVVVNIEVFKHLASHFKTTEQLLERLKRPIALRVMPLGKHKGRPFAEIPLEYLLWAANKDFDQDLLFSIRSELSRRKKGPNFLRHRILSLVYEKKIYPRRARSFIPSALHADAAGDALRASKTSRPRFSPSIYR